MSYDFSEFDLRQNELAGQLWLDDRKVLWETVRTLKPRLAAETGTWQGGGSTFFIAEAMRMNGFGLLHTVETDEAMHAIAEHRYRTQWTHLLPHVRLHHGDSLEVYREVLKGMELDFVFIDGGEGDVAIAEYELLEPLLRVGGVLCAHDQWNGKPLPQLHNVTKWDLTIVGDGSGTFESGSPGMARAVKLR